ncbi:MAG: HAD-IA family hydrolase [Rikenellaceae bacterium]
MKKLVIFDLDGTLLDTIGDLAASCDEVLRRHNMATYSLDDYKHFVGNGIVRLVERAIPDSLRSEEFIAELRKEFVAYYFENIDKHTVIYPQIMWLLEELQRRDIKIAVASNKFQEGVRKLVASFFPDIQFEAVLGQRPNIPLKPDPQIVNDIIQLTSYSQKQILYVGDSGIDMETAKAAGIESIGVTWGFRSREELVESGANHIVDSPEEILKLIE